MLNGVLAQFRTVIGHALSQVQNPHVSYVNKSAVETLEDRSVPAVSVWFFKITTQWRVRYAWYQWHGS